MKTLSQIAKDLGVSRQAVYKKLDNIPSINSFELTSKINGVLHVNEQGETLIKSAFKNRRKGNSFVNEDVKSDSKQTDNFTIIIDNLNNQVENSKEQIKMKDEQILKLQELLEHQQSLLENQQVLLKKEQEKSILLLERKTSKSFWQKWFK